MTPREVDQLTDAEFRAFVLVANQEIRANARAARKRGR